MTFQPFDTSLCPSSCLQTPLNLPSFLLGTTEPLSLSMTPTPLVFSTQFESPGVANASPAMTFSPAGYYLIHFRLPLSTDCLPTPTTFFISASLTGDASLSPTHYISAPLCSGMDHLMHVYYFLVLVATAGASIIFSVNLNTTAPHDKVWLGHGQLIAYRLP